MFSYTQINVELFGKAVVETGAEKQLFYSNMEKSEEIICGWVIFEWICMPTLG